VAFPAVKLNSAWPPREQISARSLVPCFAPVRPDPGLGHSSRPVIVRLGLARVASKYSGGPKKLDRIFVAALTVSGNASDLTEKSELFYPRQVLMDLALTALLIIGLGVLCFFAPMQLGPPANSADVQYIPRPEWYYLSIFQWLKYWHGAASVVGVLVIPTILVLAVLALPFLDRSVERRPWKRPVAMGAYAFLLFALVGLGLRSKYSDKHDPAVAHQLAKQQVEEDAYMRKPFEAELSSASLAAANVTLADPLAAKGKTVFEGNSCNACHGDGGVGTAAAPALVGISSKFSPEQVAQLFEHPTAKMTAGGMPPVDLPPDDLKALIAYVESLK
jgi:ubiquinol-cytochrome c reductase cytochrome b subunit